MRQVDDTRPSFRNPLRRIEWLLDESQVSRSRSATRLRLAIGSIFLSYGLLLELLATAKGQVDLAPVCFIVGSAPILLNRLGRLGRYFIPVALGLFAYGITANYVVKYKLTVHYTPQIDIDRAIGGGNLPTEWLQQHLYHGHTGVLEGVCVAAYLGHFVVPLALGGALALSDRARHFKFLMFSILVLAVLGAVTFVLAPTAPPWLAAQDGYITGVHHILKHGLTDLHLTSLAALEGDARAYDITAAVPSLHAAFPVVCLATAVRARMPSFVIAAIAIDYVVVVFAIVYLGEHYVFDALVGTTFAIVSIGLVGYLLRGEEAESVDTRCSSLSIGGWPSTTPAESPTRA